MVRVEEAREAARLIETALEALPSGSLAVPLDALPEGEGAFGLVEGWRGPIWHWVVAGKNNSFSASQDQRPLLRQLAGAQLRDSEKHRARFPAGE